MTAEQFISEYISVYGHMPPREELWHGIEGLSQHGAAAALKAYQQAHPEARRAPAGAKRKLSESDRPDAPKLAPRTEWQQTGESATIECRESATIRTLDDLLDAAQVDRKRSNVTADKHHPAKVVGVTADEVADPLEVLQRAINENRRKRDLYERKANQRVEFPPMPVGIYFSGDEHFGDAGTNYERVFEDVKIVLDTPGLYAWKMGDIVNQFILGRMRSIRDGVRLSIPDEWVLANKLMTDLAPKLIAVNGGNHCAHWSEIAGGVDRAREIVPGGVLYDPDEIVADLFVGTKHLSIKSRHKWLGASIYNPTHPMERAAKLDDSEADIYVGAHTHIAGLAREFVANRQRKMAILTGSYKTLDSYQRREGFPMGDGSNGVTLILMPDGSRFAVGGAEAGATVLRSLRKRR